MSEDTIFALSTGVGRAAIAVVRASGPAVRLALDEIDRSDELIKAFVSVDRSARAQASGPLRGVTFGVK
ncbi:MAG TPA: hypothetical protein PK812_06140, partial [Beijerinckiaceae bacterium]|nr:hypothetical protein [Beijerinckiaceae bacterium]